MGIVGLLVAILMAVWVYKLVNRSGGELPWLWAIGTFLIWPLGVTIAGFKYNDTGMKVVGIIGLVLIAAGVGFLAFA
jgi:hypothetical protein